MDSSPPPPVTWSVLSPFRGRNRDQWANLSKRARGGGPHQYLNPGFMTLQHRVWPQVVPWSPFHVWVDDWNNHCNLCPLKVTQLPVTSLSERSFPLAPLFPPTWLPANITPPVCSRFSSHLGQEQCASLLKLFLLIGCVCLPPQSPFYPILSKKTFLIYLSPSPGLRTTVNPMNRVIFWTANSPVCPHVFWLIFHLFHWSPPVGFQTVILESERAVTSIKYAKTS